MRTFGRELDSLPIRSTAARADQPRCSKSTLLRSLARFHKADAGHVEFTDGTDATALSPKASAGAWTVTGVAALEGLGAFALVYALAWKGGLDTSRLVLIGIGVWSLGMAATTLIILASDPWNIPKAMTWRTRT